MKRLLIGLLTGLLSIPASAATCPTFAAGDTNYISKLNQLSAGCSPTGLTGSELPRAAAGGSADAITATFSPAITLADKTIVAVVAGAANATTTPTFAPNGLTARTIVKNGGSALAAGDIAGAGHAILLEYNLAGTRWELMNPATGTGGGGSSLTATYVGYGDGSNALTGTSDFTYATASKALTIVNSSSGTAATTSINLMNDTGSVASFEMLSSGYTTSGERVAKRAVLSSSDVALVLNSPAGEDVIVTANNVEKFRVKSDGHIKVEGVTSTGATGSGALVFGTAPTIAGPTISGLTTHTVGATNTGIIASTGYSITGSNTTSAVSIAGTINTSGVVDVFKYAVTDTARGAGSNLWALYGGAAGATKLVTVGRDATLTGGLNALRIHADGQNPSTNFLWIMDLGDTTGSSPQAHIGVGLIRSTYAGQFMTNLVWDQTNKRHNVQDTAYVSSMVEVGTEGVTLHAAPVGTTHWASDVHELFQARANGADGNGASSSGYFNQSKTTLYFGLDTAQAAGWLGSTQPGLWMRGDGTNLELMRLQQHAAAATSAKLNIDKSRGNYTTAAIVNTSDALGSIAFRGFDGTNYVAGADITPIVDAAPSSGVMPGALVFRTGTNGSPTERMRIDSVGLVGIGITPTNTLHVSKTVDAGSFIRNDNASSGTAATSGVLAQAASAEYIGIIKRGASFTTSGLVVAGTGQLQDVSGRMLINTFGNFPIIFATNGSGTANEAGRFVESTGTLSLGASGSLVGSLRLNNATSGTITISPITGALGTITITAPALTGTMLVGSAVNSVSPTAMNRTITIVHGGTTYYIAAKTTND